MNNQDHWTDLFIKAHTDPELVRDVDGFIRFVPWRTVSHVREKVSKITSPIKRKPRDSQK